LLIKDNDVILFIGDSITDCGRKRDEPYDLGTGYPNLISPWFAAAHPEMNVTILNKGISGNRVRDLQKRWDKDCIDLNPDIVSILIGINDTWRRYDRNDPTSAEEFEIAYRDILTRTKERTNAKIILLEPFVLPFPEDRKEWREDLDPKIHAVRKLACEFKAILIPLDGIFARYSVYKPFDYWTNDGVHPTKKGHAVIAKAWMEATGIL